MWFHSQALGILSRKLSLTLNSFPREVFSFCRMFKFKLGNPHWCKLFLKFPLQYQVWTLSQLIKERGISSPLTTFIGAINLYVLVDWTPCLVHFKAPVVFGSSTAENYRPQSTIRTFTTEWLNFWYLDIRPEINFSIAYEFCLIFKISVSGCWNAATVE